MSENKQKGRPLKKTKNRVALSSTVDVKTRKIIEKMKGDLSFGELIDQLVEWAFPEEYNKNERGA